MHDKSTLLPATIVALLLGGIIGYAIGYRQGGNAMHMMMDGGGHMHGGDSGAQTSVSDAMKAMEAE